MQALTTRPPSDSKSNQKTKASQQLPGSAHANQNSAPGRKQEGERTPKATQPRQDTAEQKKQPQSKGTSSALTQLKATGANKQKNTGGAARHPRQKQQARARTKESKARQPAARPPTAQASTRPNRTGGLRSTSLVRPSLPTDPKQASTQQQHRQPHPQNRAQPRTAAAP